MFGYNSHVTFMKRHTTIALATSFVAVMLLGGCQTAQTRATAWEYKIVSARISYPANFKEKGFLTLGEKINQAATDGWELVSSGSDDGSPFAILRKPK